jgi:hypothetical protein
MVAHREGPTKRQDAGPEPNETVAERSDRARCPRCERDIIYREVRGRAGVMR